MYEININSDSHPQSYVDAAYDILDDGNAIEYKALGGACDVLYNVVGRLLAFSAKDDGIPTLTVESEDQSETLDDGTEITGIIVTVRPVDDE